MLKSLLLFVFLLCHRGVLCDREGPTILGWPSWLLVDPQAPSHTHEEEEPPKARRITPKSVFIAPAFSGSSPLPDCAEGYKADSMGRCVKLVQLNHAAQLNFLLQRLNAMYSTQSVEKDTNHDLTSSDSDSGPLHFTIPLDIPAEPEEETKESVEVAVVMADILKDDKKKPDEEKSQTIVAVWKTGKNGTELEELETASDLEMEAANIHIEKSNMTAPVPDTIKYDVVNINSNSTVIDKRIPTLDSGKSSSDSPVAVISSEDDSESIQEPSKGLESAVELLEEVSEIISEDGRIGNTSRRNVSSEGGVKNSNLTEEVTSPMLEKSVVKKVLTHSEEIKSSDNAPEVDVQETSETVREPSVANQRPISYIRFPSDDNYDTSDSKKVLTHSEVIEDSGSVPEVEVQKSSETVREPPSAIQRPSSSITFPSDDKYDMSKYYGSNSGVSNDGTSYNSMREEYEPIQFPQTGTYYSGSNNQPLYASDVQRRPTYWWLPPGWRLDQSMHQPMIVRFWARLPLVHEPVYQNDNRGINRQYGPVIY